MPMLCQMFQPGLNPVEKVDHTNQPKAVFPNETQENRSPTYQERLTLIDIDFNDISL